ncbi:MAG: hypothetical protein HYU25_03895 [Candidatus Rokubacteria bacterium]|nr:hypothetical protein [Candidatus Rokubacteria bacterium]
MRCSSAWRPSDGDEARRGAPRDRRRARRRDLRADDDDRARLAHVRARRLLRHLRRLHGRRLRARTRAGAGAARPPRARVRLATIAGAAPRNLTHLVFKNGVYHTSGAQETPGGLAVDYVLMAKGAGYRNAYAIRDLEEFKRRLPAMLAEEGPVLVELYTGLAEKTPMTDRSGRPFHEQAEKLRTKLVRPRA